jgi:hypothetical protein
MSDRGGQYAAIALLNVQFETMPNNPVKRQGLRQDGTLGNHVSFDLAMPH